MLDPTYDARCETSRVSDATPAAPEPWTPSGRPDTRAEILASARTLFATRGFGSTSIRAVAAEAGVDPALVHHYFGSKDDLFVAALGCP